MVAAADQRAEVARLGQRGAEVLGNQGVELGDLGGDAFEDWDDDVADGGGQGHPVDGGFGFGSAPGCAESGEGGHGDHASVVGGGDDVHVGGVGDVAELFHLAHRRGGGVDPTVEAVGRLAPDLPGDRGGEAGAASGRGGAGVGEQKGTGAEGALRLAGFHTAFAEQCGLLVDDEATDLSSFPERGVVPTKLSQATISGSRLPARLNRPSSSESQAPVSRSVASDRLAVEASVTRAPVSWCTSPESRVVTTPSRVTWRRSHACFGAEKYGSSTRPVRC